MPNTIPKTTHYSIEAIRADAHYLVKRGIVSPQQPIYILLAHLPEREHDTFEQVLERHEYLLRDRIIDLLPQRNWQND
ncbi:MAG: DUF4327 family protein [Spirulina sp. SIO3F2]|nr:DUF4327 family protein [Spirulina sp. SIO3F2]